MNGEFVAPEEKAPPHFATVPFPLSVSENGFRGECKSEFISRRCDAAQHIL